MSEKQQTYIALLRGINVGGKTALPMVGLANIVEHLGGTDVVTYLRTGNVGFKYAEQKNTTLADSISLAVSKRFEIFPYTLVMTASKFIATADYNPYSMHERNKVHLFFLFDEPEEKNMKTLLGFKSPEEEVTLHKGVLYVYMPNGFSKSKMAKKIEKVLQVKATARNMNTITKIQALFLKHA